jgi:hypothetical protein
MSRNEEKHVGDQEEKTSASAGSVSMDEEAMGPKVVE